MLGTTVALGLGSNLGNSLEYLRLALAAIRQLQNFRIQKVSSIFESDALTKENAPAEWNKKYLNAVVLVEIDGTPEPSLWLNSLKKIESDIGRKSAETWAPREIDIDILYWSREPLRTNDLNIPHVGLVERPFALLPLLEVWPELRNKIQCPDWALPWAQVKPFNTQISKKVWPRIVGILNVTPDSFSGDGETVRREVVEMQLQRFSDQGVEIVDVGAESTRPNAAVVSPQEELKRLQWAFEILKKSSSLKISLDCRRSEVAEKILSQYQVDYLNDVSGFASLSMQKLLKDSDKKAFVMHSFGVPPSKENVISEDKDPHLQLIQWWNATCSRLAEAGINSEKLIFDPGIGFGKTSAQSLFILKHLELFDRVTSEIMVGHSRKSFQNLFSARSASERDTETALVTQNLNLAHVQYLRVHNPEIQLMALRARSYLC